MHHWVMVSVCITACPTGRAVNPTLENTMMNRIRTAIESKRANNQLQSYYMWRPAPGRR